MDISQHVAPKSDQMDAVDLASGPQTFTITEATESSAKDRPVQIHLAEFPRPWRPSKSMRRVLLAGWGKETDVYTGRRITLYCDSRVTFGGEKVGGIRISHMSDIGEKDLEVPLLISQGRAAIYHVSPLTDAPKGRASKPKPAAVDLSHITDPDELRGMWDGADDATKAAITARGKELGLKKAEPAEPADGAMFPEGASS